MVVKEGGLYTGDHACEVHDQLTWRDGYDAWCMIARAIDVIWSLIIMSVDGPGVQGAGLDAHNSSGGGCDGRELYRRVGRGVLDRVLGVSRSSFRWEELWHHWGDAVESAFGIINTDDINRNENSYI